MLDFPPTPEEGKCRRRGVLRPESVGRTRSRLTIIGCPRTGLARTIVAFSGGRTPITRHATPREHCAFPRGAARINALSLHRRLAKVAGGGALWGTRAGRRVRGRGNHKGAPALKVGQNPPPRPMGAWGLKSGWPPAKSRDTPPILPPKSRKGISLVCWPCIAASKIPKCQKAIPQARKGHAHTARNGRSMAIGTGEGVGAFRSLASRAWTCACTRSKPSMDVGGNRL